jgi:hypothetical protein
MPHSRLIAISCRPLIAWLAFAIFVSLMFAEAGAQGTRTARGRSPLQQTSAAGPNAPQARRKSIVSVRSFDSSEGSRVTILSDLPLNDYEAYWGGDRYFIIIPNADVVARDTESLQQSVRGRGFQDVRIEKKGTDLVISFRMLSGMRARPEQKFNRLDVIFTPPPGAILNTDGNRNGGGITNNQGNGNRASNSSGIYTGNRGGNSSGAISNTATSGGASSSGASSTGASSTGATASTGGAGTRSGRRGGSRGYGGGDRGGGAPLNIPLPTDVQPTATPAESPVPGTSNGNSNANTNPDAVAQTSPTPGALSSPTPEQIAQNNPQQPVTAPPATTATNAPAPASNTGFAAAVKENWLPLLIGLLVLLAIGLLLVSRSRAEGEAERPPDRLETRKKEVIKEKPVSRTGAAIAGGVAGAAAATAAAKESRAKAEPVTETTKAREDKGIEPVAAPVGMERVSSEVKSLLDGKDYDSAVIGSSNPDTRQLVSTELLAALASRNPERRLRAREAYTKHGFFDETTERLRTAEAPAERISAARALGLTQDHAATQHLTAALEDSDPEVRRASVNALAELRDPSAIGPLNALLEREKNRKVPHSLIRRAIEASATIDIPTPPAAETAAPVATAEGTNATPATDKKDKDDDDREVFEI